MTHTTCEDELRQSGPPELIARYIGDCEVGDWLLGRIEERMRTDPVAQNELRALVEMTAHVLRERGFTGMANAEFRARRVVFLAGVPRPNAVDLRRIVRGWRDVPGWFLLDALRLEEVLELCKVDRRSQGAKWVRDTFALAWLLMVESADANVALDEEDVGDEPTYKPAREDLAKTTYTPPAPEPPQKPRLVVDNCE